MKYGIHIPARQRGVPNTTQAPFRSDECAKLAESPQMHLLLLRTEVIKVFEGENRKQANSGCHEIFINKVTIPTYVTEIFVGGLRVPLNPILQKIRAYLCPAHFVTCMIANAVPLFTPHRPLLCLLDSDTRLCGSFKTCRLEFRPSGLPKVKPQKVKPGNQM